MSSEFPWTGEAIFDSEASWYRCSAGAVVVVGSGQHENVEFPDDRHTIKAAPGYEFRRVRALPSLRGAGITTHWTPLGEAFLYEVMEVRQMKTMTVECTWRSTHEVEVPDDYVWDGRSLDSEWADQVDPHIAELLDWEVR